MSDDEEKKKKIAKFIAKFDGGTPDEIDLSYCGLGDEELMALVKKHIKPHHYEHIKSIYLHYNNLTDMSLNFLTDRLLRHLKNLYYLNLSNNKLSDLGTAAFAHRAMPFMIRLKLLMINGNPGIGKVGKAALAQEVWESRLRPYGLKIGTLFPDYNKTLREHLSELPPELRTKSDDDILDYIDALRLESPSPAQWLAEHKDELLRRAGLPLDALDDHSSSSSNNNNENNNNNNNNNNSKDSNPAESEAKEPQQSHKDDDGGDHDDDDDDDELSNNNQNNNNNIAAVQPASSSSTTTTTKQNPQQQSRDDLVSPMRVKLVFVGAGKVGKTATANSFMLTNHQQSSSSSPRLNLLNSDKQTMGIDMREIILPRDILSSGASDDDDDDDDDDECKDDVDKKDDSPLTFSLWDFAGQKVFYATHSVFLSAGSVFVVVFDPRHDQTGLGVLINWLETIRQRVSADRRAETLVYVVATHKDEKSVFTQEHRDELLKTFPDLLPDESRFFHISNSVATEKLPNYDWTADFRPFYEHLARSAYALADGVSKSSFKRSWLRLIELVREHRRQIDFPLFDDSVELTRLMVRAGADVRIKRVVASLLHDMGVLMYFDEQEEHGNQEIVCFDPSWLASVLERVVTNDPESTVHIVNGCVTHAKLADTLWGQFIKTPEQLTNLLQVMHRVELSYTVQGADGLPAELLPSMISSKLTIADRQKLMTFDVTQRTQSWHGWRLNRVEALPSELFSRVVVRVAHTGGRLTQWWRNCVVFEDAAQQQSMFVWVESGMREVHLAVQYERGSKDMERAAYEWLQRATRSIERMLTDPVYADLASEWLVSCPKCASKTIGDKALQPYMFGLHKLVDELLEEQKNGGAGGDEDADDDEVDLSQVLCASCSTARRVQMVSLVDMCRRMWLSPPAQRLVQLTVQNQAQAAAAASSRTAGALASIQVQLRALRDEMQRESRATRQAVAEQAAESRAHATNIALAVSDDNDSE